MIHSLSMIWNPSEGIDLGFIKLRYYSLMFVIAFGLGWFLMKKIYDREGESVEKLDKLFIYTVLATLVGARLGHVFFYDWAYYKDHLFEIISPVRFTPKFEIVGFSGLASHGAAIAIITVMYFYSKKIVQKPVLWILDRITIPVAIGGMFVRFGNFFNSEIVGHETASAFGIRFIRDKFTPRQAMEITGLNDYNQAYDAIQTNPQFAEALAIVAPKHPTQLYEAFGYLIVFLIVYYMYWKTDARKKLGYIFGVFLVLLWAVRFVVEYVKDSQGGFEETLGYLSTGQWLSIPFIIIGIYLWATAKNKKYEA
ncbi:prolipoprotein diacylglyceryl transferase [Myroides marinus]|uniref:Phosphatidylglycerol--prolipoprotein diacylglyceryl transferase n=1 Tax=Myroides marinus TaxID=703342 RepID=A0A163X212_9FLAO|nr:prolipoprotein diacylglyceryl transferase [Myroides marinus]MDR0194548.1 prolipoprotein diacylglyceryl transferase [Myroides sp.]KZE77183.1 prolipoprotein diacylglyceryl transferase [Myroides marinus]MDM1347910.1 prolipoprotein diacylglyceryl transferase [Myroides marinus]MDM1352355.1 prolipoprotein diacylglyceryl transferase [Myroides marinus]MDM1355489.1 prolipoprotein diacylglyceryl transferase [Myroides marinus]